MGKKPWQNMAIYIGDQLFGSHVDSQKPETQKPRNRMEGTEETEPQKVKTPGNIDVEKPIVSRFEYVSTDMFWLVVYLPI